MNFSLCRRERREEINFLFVWLLALNVFFCGEFDAGGYYCSDGKRGVRCSFLLTAHSRVAVYSIKVYVAVSAALPPFACLAF